MKIELEEIDPWGEEIWEEQLKKYDGKSFDGELIESGIFSHCTFISTKVLDGSFDNCVFKNCDVTKGVFIGNFFYNSSIRFMENGIFSNNFISNLKK